MYKKVIHGLNLPHLPRFWDFEKKMKLGLCHLFSYMVFYLHAKNQILSSSSSQENLITDGRMDMTDFKEPFSE